MKFVYTFRIINKSGVRRNIECFANASIGLDRQLLTVTNRFRHLPSGWCRRFHHDSPAFSVSGHLWVDAIDAHVTFQFVKPSYFWPSSRSGSRHYT